MPSRFLVFLAAALLLAAAAAPAMAQTAAPVPREVIIKDISKAGAVIDLMDGSQWRINDIGDQKIVYDTWLPAQSVIVEPGNMLRNIYTGEEVQAVRLKKATKLPSAPEDCRRPGPARCSGRRSDRRFGRSPLSSAGRQDRQANQPGSGTGPEDPPAGRPGDQPGARPGRYALIHRLAFYCSLGGRPAAARQMILLGPPPGRPELFIR